MVYPSKELIIFQCLQGRKTFSKTEEHQHYKLLKGYEGEKQFSNLLKEQLHQDHLQINDLLLNNHGTVFQLDTLLIFNQTVYLFEVKNYQGEFQLEKDYLHCYTTGKNYRNPLHQLKRSELMLTDLLSNMDMHFQVKSYLIFINHRFTLFQATRNHPIILPTQVFDFIRRLNQIPGTISPKHQQLANKLHKMHIEKLPYTRYPDYNFDQLKKGILCKNCRRHMENSRFNLYCYHCSYQERIDSGVLRHVIEFNLLFPEKIITSGIIYKWIGHYISRTTIQNILAQYMKQEKKNRYTRYTFK
ncbi:MAG TPA: nuclease-related domain-containing protein [Pseudogracilibacillus sp.]|nr:nuclease-related domain-containing protein [Pseudogracilibacillus sp.]